jgi:hypothetical protein
MPKGPKGEKRPADEKPALGSLRAAFLLWAAVPYPLVNRVQTFQSAEAITQVVLRLSAHMMPPLLYFRKTSRHGAE